jgi:tRNA threonylcarbamoyladenosine biosynthesis protein TsaB
MICLKIDTSEQNQIEVILEIDGKEKIIKEKFLKGSEILLPSINKLLTENNLKIEDVNKVFVKRGPGSYTGIRVGLSVANALSHFLKIPINDDTSGKIIEPIYK